MKLTKYFMPFAALAVLASCSNDNDAPAVDTPNGEGTVAAMFKVTLPALDDTRAITANDFEDGESDGSEYKVNDVTFYIFKTAAGGEDKYTYLAKSDTFYPAAQNDPTADITRNATITVQFPESEIGDIASAGSNTYYGLCVVNKPSTGFTEPGTGDTFGTWKVKDGNTYAGFKHNGGFTMTNAPTFDSQANDVLVNPHTLVALNANNFVKSPATPSTSAGTFFVQRGVAKVKIAQKTGSDWKILSTVSSSPQQHFLLENWALDVTNTKSYPVQVITNVVSEMAAAKAKRTAYTVATSGVEYFYTELTNAAGKAATDIRFNHIWWGSDPNYDSAAATGDFASASTYNAISSKTFDYCLENLMPYNRQNQDETTRVVFKGKYSLDGTTYSDFIVANANDKAMNITSDMLVSDPSAPAAGSSVALNTIINEEDYEGNTTGYEDYLTDGKISNLEMVALQLGIPTTGNVDYYKGGETFYVARIKHFNPETETVWSSDSTKEGYGVTSSTPAKAQYNESHLGRYGVLRNNVYYITVNQVLGFGSPTVPEPGDPDDPTPDDEIDPVKYNMNVEINILAWAKRNYDYDLK